MANTKKPRAKGTDTDRLATLRAELLAAAREAEAKGERRAFTATLPDGNYVLSEPFVLSAEAEPALALLDITLRAEHPLGATVSSLTAVDGEAFTPVAGTPFFTYRFERNADGAYPAFHDLFLDGEHLSMSASPVWRNPTLLSPEEKRGEAELYGLYAPLSVAQALNKASAGTGEYMIYIEWQFCVLHVEGADLSDVREFDGEPYARLLISREELNYISRHCHGNLNIRGRETFLRNAPAFLTPDTYAYDAKSGVLTVYPADGKMAGHTVAYPMLENLFVLDGLSNTTVEGIDFTGTTSGYVCLHPYYSGQANCESTVRRLRHAALVTANMQNLTLSGCAFRDLGGNGVLIADRTLRLTVTDCRFARIAMCALSVGNPTTEWEDPKNRSYAVRIENNLFRHVAYDYPSALCIYIGGVDTLKILRNTVDGCGYSGISIGWGWAAVPYELGEKVNVRDAEVAFNRFHNFMDVLRDGAAIYTVGANCHHHNTRRFNCMHDNFASLDERRDSSKRGYYCDGSSTNWEVRDSVVVNCALPLFSQFHVPSAGTYHNTLHRVYSTTPIDKGNFAPDRDTVLGENFVVTAGEEALYEAYPEAKAIRDAAGCRLAE